MTLLVFLCIASSAQARAVNVSTAPEIVSAVNNAQAGDVITVAPGTYDLPGLRLTASGNPQHKIVLRAAKPGTVELRSSAIEFMKISAPDWEVEDFDIAGTCTDDSKCEHAFHIVGRADRTIIRGNRIHDYNAHIKGNGENSHFPSDVLIENNLLFDTRPRVTDNPIAPVDVVGGSRWVVRGNLIADFGKELAHPPERTDDWSYAMFLKGNSERGLIAGNIVGCDIDAPPTPSIRGIALGGSAPVPVCAIKAATALPSIAKARSGATSSSTARPSPASFSSKRRIRWSRAMRSRPPPASKRSKKRTRPRSAITASMAHLGASTRRSPTRHEEQCDIQRAEAETALVRPLARQMSAKPGSARRRGAEQIAAYRAYLATLIKP